MVENATNPVLEDFEKACKANWETQSAETARAVEVDSPDDSNNEGLLLQQRGHIGGSPTVIRSTLASVTGVMTRSCLRQEGTGSTIGAAESLNRELENEDSTDLGKSTSLKVMTSTVTRPSLVQVGTGVVTGVATDLDWVLSDGEDDTQANAGRRGDAMTSAGRPSSFESAAATQTSTSVSVRNAAQLSSADLLVRLNSVCTTAARTTIPTVETDKPSRVRPSDQSKQFAEQRAVEIAVGVTPSRKKELHKKLFP